MLVTVGVLCALAGFLHVFHEPFGTLDKMVLALPSFMLGIVAADLRLRAPLKVSFLPAALVGGAALGIFADFRWAPWAMLPWGICAFAFTVLAGRRQWLGACLTLPVMSAVGIASYSIYLVHEPILAMLEFAHAPAVVAFLCAIAAGFVFWWIVERPMTTAPLRNWLLAVTSRAFIAIGTRLRFARPVAVQPAVELSPSSADA